MTNPWASLQGEAPCVLEADAAQVAGYNRAERGRDPFYSVQLDVPPTPFTGNLRGTVVLLNLNPRYSDAHPEEFADAAYRSAILANLRQDPLHRRFISLDPVWRRKAGHRWWTRKTRQLVEAVGLEAVLAHVVVVECLSCHSRRFCRLTQPLPSEQSGFDVVPSAYAARAAEVSLGR